MGERAHPTAVKRSRVQKRAAGRNKRLSLEAKVFTVLE
jgi:hypothetical protein